MKIDEMFTMADWCEYCTIPCPQAELAREIGKGRMYAMQTIAEMQKELQAYKDAEERGELVRVVHCRECYWWDKQADSAQGRCALSGSYPTGNWYCANGTPLEEKRNV